MKKEITWLENGWTNIQDADEKKHILGIACYAENGMVLEVRRRHNDGEEEKLTKKLVGEYTLPMPLADFKKLLTDGTVTLK